MEGGDFYEDLLKKNLAVEYMKKLEAAITPDALINIRTTYLMSCISTNRSENWTTATGISNKNKRLSPAVVNTKIKEPVGIKAENHEVISENGAESDEDILDLPKEVKFEIFSDSEPEESSTENLTGEEPKSKRLCQMKPTSNDGIALEIKEPTDLNPIDNEVSSAKNLRNLINIAVIMENIFKHLPLTDLLSFRTVSTDWNKKIIFHLDRNNTLRDLSFENQNWKIKEFISLMKSSKQIPFTKFNLITHRTKKN